MAYNTARIEALELENLMEVAEATAIAADQSVRKVVVLMPVTTITERDDENWLCTFYSIFRKVRSASVSVM